MSTNRSMPTTVDQFMAGGCGRCELANTPSCKVNPWLAVLIELRKLVLTCDLKETVKWGVPCYTHQDKNVLLLHVFKDHCGISFMQGNLLDDPYGLLVQPTENSYTGRQMRYYKPEDVIRDQDQIRTYVFAAMELIERGVKSESKPVSAYEVPEELKEAFKADQAFELAFQALTPGRQKGYLLHFAQAKQAATRSGRIAKWKPQIMKGLGFHDR